MWASTNLNQEATISQGLSTSLLIILQESLLWMLLYSILRLFWLMRLNHQLKKRQRKRSKPTLLRNLPWRMLCLPQFTIMVEAHLPQELKLVSIMWKCLSLSPFHLRKNLKLPMLTEDLRQNKMFQSIITISSLLQAKKAMPQPKEALETKI